MFPLDNKVPYTCITLLLKFQCCDGLNGYGTFKNSDRCSPGARRKLCLETRHQFIAVSPWVFTKPKESWTTGGTWFRYGDKAPLDSSSRCVQRMLPHRRQQSQNRWVYLIKSTWREGKLRSSSPVLTYDRDAQCWYDKNTMTKKWLKEEFILAYEFVVAGKAQQYVIGS